VIAKQRILRMRFANPIALMMVSVFSTESILLYPASEMKKAFIITVNLKDNMEIT
jgi:hypothetical protein